MPDDYQALSHTLRGDVYRTGMSALNLSRTTLVPIALWLARESAGLVHDRVTGLVPGLGDRGVVRMRNLTALCHGQERDYVDLPASLREAIDRHTYEFNRSLARYRIPVSVCEDALTGEKSLFFAAKDAKVLQRALESFLRGSCLFSDEDVTDILEGREPRREREVIGPESASAPRLEPPSGHGEDSLPDAIPHGWSFDERGELVRTLDVAGRTYELRADLGTGLVSATSKAEAGMPGELIGSISLALPMTVGRLEQCAEMLEGRCRRRPAGTPAQARRKVSALARRGHGTPDGRDAGRAL